jgi:aspartate ammonia-lyase
MNAFEHLENETMRIEKDLLGERQVPADVCFGIHTLRAMENFDLTGRRMHPALVGALAQVKKACAMTNLQLGLLKESVGHAILQACDEILAGKLHDHILVDPLQGGAGTSANMNLNEVIANRGEEILGGCRGAYRLVHPLDHVNLNQSTNDVFPTAVKVAAIQLLKKLEPAVAGLQGAFQAKEQEFADVVKLGRTQLQDAAPMTVGAEFSAWAEALSRDRWRIFKCEERLRVVNLGATAIGTGLTAPREYIFQVVENLRQETGLGLSRAENLVDATQNADAFVEVSGILKAHAVNLIKITSDLRLLASGPKAGLMELVLPEMQAGSSIMPGKVNPVICEAAGQAAMLTLAYDMAIGQAALSGQLELNAFLPLVAEALLSSLSLLQAADKMLHTRCVDGIQVNREACREHVERSWATVTALVPRLGYDKATEIAGEVKRSGKTVSQVVLDKGYLDQESLRSLLCPDAMTTLGFGG